MVDYLFDSAGRIPEKIVSKLVSLPVDFDEIWRYEKKVHDYLKAKFDFDIISSHYNFAERGIEIEASRELTDEEWDMLEKELETNFFHLYNGDGKYGPKLIFDPKISKIPSQDSTP